MAAGNVEQDLAAREIDRHPVEHAHTADSQDQRGPFAQTKRGEGRAVVHEEPLPRHHRIDVQELVHLLGRGLARRDGDEHRARDARPI